MLDDLFRELIESGAEMLSLRAGAPPTITTQKQATPLEMAVLTDADMKALADALLDGEPPPIESPTNTWDGRRDAGILGCFDFRVKLHREQYVIGIRAGSSTSSQSATPADEKARPESKKRSRSLKTLLRDGARANASDVHVTAGAPASFRVDGILRTVDGAVFTSEELRESLAEVLTPERLTALKETGSVDAAFEVPDENRAAPLRYRMNLFQHLGGLSAAFRIIQDTIPSFADLHLPSQVADLVQYNHGLLLITGPTGSGKSTTLCALLEHINQTQQRHIITLEDPIEFLFTRKDCLVHQREVGQHVDSFATGLRAALREDPDIILVGEMRDKETIQAAITAAETGHLVLSSLHCGSAAQAVDRMIDIFDENQQNQIRLQLSDVLRAVVTQRLIRTTRGMGRVPAVEILRVNPAVSTLIRDKKSHMMSNQIQTSRSEGMLPFDTSLLELIRARHISTEAAMKVAKDTAHLQRLLESAGLIKA
jgi:twitching motility protein PilT